MTVNAVTKYLKNYAEAEAQLLGSWPDDCNYAHVLVIPCYDESAAFYHRLRSGLLEQNQGLLIAIVNRPQGSEKCDANEALLKTLSADLPLRWQQNNLSLFSNQQQGVLVVDRDSCLIPRKQGVGLARKIGCDLAAELILRGHIKSSWIHSSDADAHLPQDYFSAIKPLIGDNTLSAATYNFHHRADDSDVGQATQWYERSLHHYVDGLRRAGSPYGFHTIGSILAFSSQAYCQARGFPKRAGGEDFYLLNKLAKLGRVISLSPVIELDARVSHRVPFGTGPATGRIIEQFNRQEIPCSYHPEIFTRLAHWLQQAVESCHDAYPLSNVLPRLDSASQAALQNAGIEDLCQHLQTSTNPAWKVRHFHHWFDAFRTLKFVHYLQDNGLAPQPLPATEEVS